MVESERFIILVVDSDPLVEVVSASLLAAAFESKLASCEVRVRVLSSSKEFLNLQRTLLPEGVQNIQLSAKMASDSEISDTQLIVAFSGLDQVRVHSLRDRGIAAPAVGLCQFVINLTEILQNYDRQKLHDVRQVIAGAALHFGIDGGSSNCAICADKVSDSFDYWINIADTCSKFAQIVRKI